MLKTEWSPKMLLFDVNEPEVFAFENPKLFQRFKGVFFFFSFFFFFFSLSLQ